jgi:hypothetical protein
LRTRDLAGAPAKPRIMWDRTMAGAVLMSIACGAGKEADIT